MGVDCSLTLPNRARVRDVADVMGMLLGCRSELHPLTDNAIYNTVEGVAIEKYQTDALAQCCYITINPPGGRRWEVMYHFEWDRNGGGRGIILRSRAEYLALLVGLAKFFGGIMDYMDSDEVSNDFEAPENSLIGATNGQEWDDWQRAMHAVQPLTKADIAAMREHAAYQD